MKKFFLFFLVLILFYPTNVFALENFSLSDISSGDFFGHDIESIGDIDGDGISDIAVGAPYDDDGGPSHGAVYILFLNSDGTVKDSQKISSTEGNFKEILDPYDAFGRAISNIGDFNGDGISDIVVGAYHDDDGGYNTGAVYILFLNSDGTVKDSQKISSTEGNFQGVIDSGDCWGNAITSLNDFDGDGITDIAVGAHGDSENGFSRGAVYILFLNSDGTVNFYEKINSKQNNFKFQLNDSDMFGTSVTNIGDINNDGITDIAVGSPGDDDTKELLKTIIEQSEGSSRGAVYILFLNSDGTVKDSQKISSTEGNFQQNLQSQDMFGFSTANLSDINNDGITDIAVGSPHRHYFDAELSPIHILLLEKDGKVKYSETIPSENDTKINPEIYYFLGIPLIFVIFLVIIAKIKLRNSNQK